MFKVLFKFATGKTVELDLDRHVLWDAGILKLDGKYFVFSQFNDCQAIFVEAIVAEISNG